MSDLAVDPTAEDRQNRPRGSTTRTLRVRYNLADQERLLVLSKCAREVGTRGTSTSLLLVQVPLPALEVCALAPSKRTNVDLHRYPQDESRVPIAHQPPHPRHCDLKVLHGKETCNRLMVQQKREKPALLRQMVLILEQTCLRQRGNDSWTISLIEHPRRRHTPSCLRWIQPSRRRHRQTGLSRLPSTHLQTQQTANRLPVST